MCVSVVVAINVANCMVKLQISKTSSKSCRLLYVRCIGLSLMEFLGWDFNINPYHVIY